MINPLCLMRHIREAWLHGTDLISFLGQLTWSYSHKLPNWVFNKENIISFRYPEPIGNVTFMVRNNRSDNPMFVEVFKYLFYNLGLMSAPKTILDLGANAGFTSVYLHKYFPKAQIACVEPIPRNIEVLRKNLMLNQVQAQIFPAAVAIEDGSVLMEISPYDFSHAIITSSESVAKTREILSVPSLTVPTICEKLGWDHIDLMKIDIEGYENILFSADCSWLHRVNVLCIEWHDNSTKENLSRLAEQYGFNKPRYLREVWVLDRAQNFKSMDIVTVL